MDLERLVKDYISAWNRQDVEGLLALMHSGAAYYDAFWRETCVGRDLVRYLNDSVEDYTYFYQLVGDVIVTDSGVAFRYSAHKRGDSTSGKGVFSGVEVLTLRDGKILTVSNHYCDPRQECIEELAELEAERHGESRYAKGGLPFHRVLRIKRLLSAAMNQDRLFLNPTLTISQLAGQIGCPDDQLLQVMSIENRADFHNFLDQQRARYAVDLLAEEFDDNVDLSIVATQAGFRSVKDFCNAFKTTFGESPPECRGRNTNDNESGDDSVWH